MDRRRQLWWRRPGSLVLVATCVFGFSAVACGDDEGGATGSTPGDGNVVTVPTAPRGQVDDDLGLSPPATLVVTPPTVEDGVVDDNAGPGTSEMIVDWFDLFRNGQLADLEQQLAAADPGEMSEPIAVFETLIALERDESVSSSELETLENLAAEPDTVEPALARVVNEAVEIAIDHDLLAPEVAGD